MNHYLLIYHLGPGYLERRPEFRAEHLALAWAAAERGELLLGGAVEDPVDTAMLLFAGEGPDVAETFAQADPYVTAGLVERWNVRRWTTVVGAHAAAPVRP
ncbi:YciI-like protein [Novosphingobium resinovorum]|uniref:YciI-like protein n=1 Tax=Novosphingobium resinovorum TaxID=158500 RepID=UPI002ED4FF3E|nr:YciI-like protein [Novosphingobium resinovorum]